MSSIESPSSGPALPPVEDLLDGLAVVRIPLAVRFRGVTEREVALLRGPAGWGEFSPFLEYAPPEASTWLLAAVESATLGPPRPRRRTVPVNITVPAVEPRRVEAVLRRYGEAALGDEGAATTVKVKVAELGQGVEDDVARLAEVRRLVPRAQIRVDANMGWGRPSAGESAEEDVSLAVEALSRLADFDLQYAEQPVASVSGLRRVRSELARRDIPVLIAADESIRKAEDPLRVAREDAADVIVVKHAPLGGARRALSIIAQSGLPAVVSSALDTSVGLSAGVALAAALPELPYANGLGTLSLADDDVARVPLRLGILPDEPLSLPVGIPEVDDDALDRLAVSPERRRAWVERIRACYAEAESQRPG